MALRSHCDILIAGGGPAGLATAIALRQRGADVLVADAMQPPVDKPCGEGLMPDARRELARLGVEPDTRHGAEFQGIRFSGDEAQVSADFPHGLGLGLRRTQLHRLLLQRAEDLGVRMLWNAPVTLRAGEPVALGTQSLRYRWLIGADGQASRVRAWAGLEAASIRSRRFGHRAHFRLLPDSGYPWSPYVEIHWGSRGQAYVTPVSRDEVCVSAMTREPGLRLGDILAAIPALRDRLSAAQQSTPERGALTVTRRLHRVASGNVALVGDASGSADAITGEGLAMSFREALLLADSLAAGGLDLYAARHSQILTLPQHMASLMLLLDRFPRLRARILPVLAARPQLFAGMLAVHVGEQPMPQFLLRHGAELGALLLAPGLA